MPHAVQDLWVSIDYHFHPYWVLHLLCVFLFSCSNELCTIEFQSGEFGVYSLVLDSEGKACTVSTALEPVNSNLALLYSFLICLLIGITIQAVIFSSKKGYLDSLKEKMNQYRGKLGFEVNIKILVNGPSYNPSTLQFVLKSGRWKHCEIRANNREYKKTGKILGYIPWNLNRSHDICQRWWRRLLLYGACNMEWTLCSRSCLSMVK